MEIQGNIKYGMGGLYQLTKRKVLSWNDDGTPNELSEPTYQSPWFDNLITDSGLDQLGGAGGNPTPGTDNLAYCRIGTGNTTPANTDTGLQTQVGSTNAAGTGSAVGVSVGGDYVYRRVAKRFNAGTVSGLNLAEIGMGYASTGNLFSRALILDGLGAPTTITLLPDEILDVIYELRAYLPAQDQTFTPTIDGVVTTVVQRYYTLTAQLTAFAANLGAMFHMDSGVPDWSLNGSSAETQTLVAAATGIPAFTYPSNTMCDSRTYSTYIAGSKTRSVTLLWGITKANFATGIGSIYVGTEYGVDGRETCPWPAIGYNFSTKLNKTNIRKATVVLSISWDRH